jgi:hypothetical protein
MTAKYRSTIKGHDIYSEPWEYHASKSLHGAKMAASTRWCVGYAHHTIVLQEATGRVGIDGRTEYRTVATRGLSDAAWRKGWQEVDA